MVHRRPQTLDRLTSLRAFAALAVFVFHLDHDGMWAPFPRLVALGQAGITFFFILSGFVLVWAHPDHDTPFRFYRRRFARVYPSHFVMLLVTVIVPTVAVARGVPEAIVSATLTQGWFAPTENLVYGMNGVSWTLSCEAFFYLIFPFALLILVGSPIRSRVRLGIGWFALTALVTVIGVAVRKGSDIVDVDPVLLSGEFIVGVTAAVTMKEGWKPAWNTAHALALTALVVAVLVATNTSSAVVNVLLTLPFAGLVVAAAMQEINGSRGWLTSRWLIYAGQVSFCFYLVHEVVLVNLRSHVDGFVGSVICLVVAAAAAVALHHGVELPMQRRLRGRQTRAPVGAEAPSPWERRKSRRGRRRAQPHRRPGDGSRRGSCVPSHRRGHGGVASARSSLAGVRRGPRALRARA